MARSKSKDETSVPGVAQTLGTEMANLVFEENDTLEFDPDKFFALIARMERQKAAYAMKDDTVATKALKSMKMAENQLKQGAEEGLETLKKETKK
jgi:hypothetical protein